METCCEYCRLSGEQELREVREFAMHNGSIFRLCRPHFERMSSRSEDGKNGYEIAALECALARGEQASAAWKFPRWASLPVVQSIAPAAAV